MTGEATTTVPGAVAGTGTSSAAEGAAGASAAPPLVLVVSTVKDGRVAVAGVFGLLTAGLLAVLALAALLGVRDAEGVVAAAGAGVRLVREALAGGAGEPPARAEDAPPREGVREEGCADAARDEDAVAAAAPPLPMASAPRSAASRSSAAEADAAAAAAAADGVLAALAALDLPLAEPGGWRAAGVAAAVGFLEDELVGRDVDAGVAGTDCLPRSLAGVVARVVADAAAGVVARLAPRDAEAGGGEAV